MKLRFFVVLPPLLFSVIAFAGITEISVAESTASRVLTDSSKTYIFGGSAGACTSSTLATDTICDSCREVTTLCSGYTRVACNSRSIHSSLKLRVNYKVDAVPSGYNVLVMLGDKAVTLSSSDYTTPAANTALYVDIPWSEIANASSDTTNKPTLCDTSGGTSCGEGKIYGILYVGLSNDTTKFADDTFKKSFYLEYRGIRSTPGYYSSAGYPDFHSDCGNSLVTPATYEGFCDFSTYPGDGKTYIRDLFRMSTAPASVTEIKWYAARFYYKANTASFCDVAPATASYQDLVVADRTKIDTTLVTNKVGDLENDVTYRVMMATVDDAQNVQYFSDPSSYLNDNIHSVKPSEVIGLLDGKKCFIATAAYGSAMDEHVDLLRKFRDRFLLPYEVGRELVQFYYYHSPPVAKFISHSESLRFLARVVLWPIVWTSGVFIEEGVIIGSALLCLELLILFAGLIYLAKRLKKKSNGTAA